MTQKKSQRQPEQQSQIKVFLRIRPMKNQYSKRTLKIIEGGVAFHYRDNKIHQLYFDQVFDEQATQQKVFRSACLPMINDVLEGNNASLFVYGQTGTGKTFTMGTLETIKRQDQGLIPLALKQIMSTLGRTKRRQEWAVHVSFMQIYMQDIYDLFNPSNGKLQIRESPQQGQTYVQDLVMSSISTYEQGIQLVNTGLKQRKVGHQKMNQLSSRSHTIFTIYVSQKISQTQYIFSNFSLIDLAGSERVKKSNSVDLRLDQAKFINTSLSSLGNVISALAQNNSQKFIPYRSSKLTRILKDSLTGKSKISVICTLQISQQNVNETYSTLLFADRCKQIRLPNQPVINIQRFQQLDQQKDIKMALDRSLQKQKQYLQIIKTLQQQTGSRSTQNSVRQQQLSAVIDSIYKIFGQMNVHLKKLLDPQNKNSIVKEELPKITPSTTIASIKQNVTTLAKQTIQHINNLSTIAFGQTKYQNINANGKIETQTLTSIVLDVLRQNIKLYEINLVKDNKDSFQKQICLDQYQKQKKQQIINKLKSKKLKNLQNNFQQIWSQAHHFSNPLTSLLNGIRKGQSGVFPDKISSAFKTQPEKGISNPKQFLKMLTRQQSQRKHKQMLIDEEQVQPQLNKQITGNQSSLKGSKISYFQKASPKQKKQQLQQSSHKQEQRKGINEIKKLLDTLISNKSMHEDKLSKF